MKPPYYEAESVRLFLGDCLEVMREMPECSVEAVCTDPPAGINFMNKAFDSDRGGRTQWVAWLTEIMAEALRVTKPGGHAFVWALPRTSHWTAWALEDAGWEIRDVVHHIFGSGFPKSLSVGKAIDRMAGSEREIVGEDRRRLIGGVGGNSTNHGRGGIKYGTDAATAPATEAAKQWEGFGTALKPSVENWILCRRPLSESSIARNVLKWNCGALDIDATRVGTETVTTHSRGKNEAFPKRPGENTVKESGRNVSQNNIDQTPRAGRWPPNLLISHVPPDENGEGGCERVGVKRVRGSHDTTGIWNSADGEEKGHLYNRGWNPTIASRRGSGYTDPDGFEEVEEWICQPNCPVAEIDRQSGTLKSGGKAGKRYEWKENHGAAAPFASEGDLSGRCTSDSGGASRFFKCFEPDVGPGFKYVAKASKRERSANDLVENTHSTVKPLSLMNWLLKLVVPPNGVVLDPFCGSGTTLVAARELGIDAVGIEAEEEYCRIAASRIAASGQERPSKPRPPKLAPKPSEDQLNLFGDTA